MIRRPSPFRAFPAALTVEDLPVPAWEGDDVHRNDAMQETVSLADRFGLHVTFQRPGKAAIAVEQICFQLLYRHVHHIVPSKYDFDMNEIILEKDKAASVKYGHRTNLEQFILDKRRERSGASGNEQNG